MKAQPSGVYFRVIFWVFDHWEYWPSNQPIHELATIEEARVVCGQLRQDGKTAKIHRVEIRFAK